jgi:hypothetical protein
VGAAAALIAADQVALGIVLGAVAVANGVLARTAH